MWSLVWKPILAAVVGGAACGIVGVWVVLLNLPFVGVAMSHAAFAGAIAGLLFGVSPLLSSLLLCAAAALAVGPLADRADIEPPMSLGIIFSLMLGLAFLGIGFLPGPRTEALGFIWGNILLVTTWDLLVLGGCLLVVLGFALLFHKEIIAVLFSREVARAVGIAERPLFLAMLVLCGMVVTANLNTIGGLLVFSLVVNPPSAAYQLTWRLRTMYVLSAVFAAASCLAGLAASWLFDAPAGAVIIIVSCVLFGVSLLMSPKRRQSVPV